jgi:hypothetical protein
VRLQDSGFRINEFMVLLSGYTGWDLELRVWGSGFKV